MHSLTRIFAVFSATALLVTAAPVVAFADQWGNVNCDKTPDDPKCVVEVVDSGGGGGNDGGAGNVVCTIGGKVVDCYNDYGWLGSDGCYYRKDSHNYLPEHEWIRTCIDRTTGDVVSLGSAMLFDPPLALGVATQRAVDQLAMPRPAIAASPSLTTTQFVHVPVWWWVRPGWWRTYTAHASAGGLTITAKATPTNITWYAGDGTSTVCTGPGTPWTGSTDPTAASPTCGHTYATTSAGSDGGTFTVRAVVTWQVSWSGGGYAGSVPGITTATSTNVTVTEFRAVITG